MSAEDEFTIDMGGEDFTLNRYNTTLFTFWGRVTLRDYEMDAKNFNHVFIRLTPDEVEPPQGVFVFNDHPMFQRLFDIVFEHNYPRYLDSTFVAEGDVRAWERHMFGDLEETEGVPKQWSE